MTASRIDIFRQILESDPANGAVLFGLAKEYEKAGLNEELIDALNRYLAATDDEGNAYGMLARAYEKNEQRDQARAAYARGIEAAQRHGHPSMAEEYRTVLSTDYEG
jgi:predicted Zn-dependent protease